MKKSEAEQLARQILEAAGFRRNFDSIPFEIGKEYRWKDFGEYIPERGWVKKICKFKVLETTKDQDGETECTVEYTKGPYKVAVVKIPLNAMPETVEVRNEDSCKN